MISAVPGTAVPACRPCFSLARARYLPHASSPLSADPNPPDFPNMVPPRGAPSSLFCQSAGGLALPLSPPAALLEACCLACSTPCSPAEPKALTPSEPLLDPSCARLPGDTSCWAGSAACLEGDVICLAGSDWRLDDRATCLGGGDSRLAGSDWRLDDRAMCLAGGDSRLAGSDWRPDDRAMCLAGGDSRLDDRAMCLAGKHALSGGVPTDSASFHLTAAPSGLCSLTGLPPALVGVPQSVVGVLQSIGTLGEASHWALFKSVPSSLTTNLAPTRGV